MGRIQRSPEELTSVATEHLCHTVEMFRVAAYQLSINRKDKLTTTLFREALGTHAGALVQFLFPDGKYTEDQVLAEDFFYSSDAWNAIRGTFPRSLAALRGSVDRQSPRLTYRHWANSETDVGKVAAIAGSLHLILDTFIDNAPKLDIRAKERLAHSRYMSSQVLR